MLLYHRREQLSRHLSVARLSANSMSMNLGNAAAFALVGWYLMAPPKRARIDFTTVKRAIGFEKLSNSSPPEVTIDGRAMPPALALMSQFTQIAAVL